MSYTFNPLGPGGLHPMHPLLSAGGGFLTAQQLGSPAAAANAALLAGINNKPLEFKVKSAQNGSGSAPMELETVAEHETIKDGNTIASMEKAREENLNKKMLEEFNKHQNQLQQHVAANGGELVFNQLLPQQPHGFMMMPGVMNMVDGSSLISMQPFPMMAPNASDLSGALNNNTVNNVPPGGASVATNGTGSPEKPASAKEVIYCKNCTLFPPNPNAPPPKTIERPPGCRTVFVGGLPTGMTEEVMREIFERCGEITTLRLSKKNFCHIRYVYEASVDSAIYLSGYRVKIGSNFSYGNPEAKEPPIFGVLHVDYAQARDDQYEYECKQRKLQREKRHRERLEEDRFRSLSPQPVVHYTEHEASSVAERLKNDETFAKAVQTLVTWLERGDCSKKNSNNFYSMIQSTNSHVRRLLSEKGVCDEELKRAREQYRRQTKTMLAQFSQIEKVFNAASHKKVWDHFTKAQRKNIDAWKKQSLCVQLDDFPDDDGMDMSDDDHSVSSLPFKKSRWEHEHKDHTGDSERSGADGTESTVVSHDGELKMKILHIEVLQETIRNLQTQLLENKAKETERQNRICELEDELKDANVKQLLLKTKIATSKVAASSTASISSSKGDSEGESDYACTSAPETGAPTAAVCKATSTRDVGSGESFPPPVASELGAPNEKEVKMVAFAATFMMIHPLGVPLDQVWAYVGRYVAELKPKELEDAFARYPQLFKRCVLAPGMVSGPDSSASGGSVEQNQDRISSPWYRFVGHESSNVRD
ncbi:ecto-NOX disulfide-thiol exchanger 1 isoform X2 [Anopheles coustani]|uniref:ecto-NOX disulfide-thiol exchanger 1 isoform X2 n=1 Tax=Anopheles coustani TaxID=139045 RepID=UPI002659CDC6|nr:ecto-NOX disulfide-thiol exchanger 1 isoform X2 [Anopheles coustani]